MDADTPLNAECLLSSRSLYFSMHGPLWQMSFYCLENRSAVVANGRQAPQLCQRHSARLPPVDGGLGGFGGLFQPNTRKLSLLVWNDDSLKSVV
jgi:hypothetical protein